MFVPFAQLKRLYKFFPLPWGARPPGSLWLRPEPYIHIRLWLRLWKYVKWGPFTSTNKNVPPMRGLSTSGNLAMSLKFTPDRLFK